MTRILDLIPRTRTFAPTGIFFDRFGENFDLPSLFEDGKSWVPAFDISETDKEYMVTAEIPGINVKDLDVTLSEGILTVKGEKKQEKEDNGENYHRVERTYGSFQRSFRIPEKVEAETVDAAYKDGVLKLTLKKAEAIKPKKIEIK